MRVEEPEPYTGSAETNMNLPQSSRIWTLGSQSVVPPRETVEPLGGEPSWRMHTAGGGHAVRVTASSHNLFSLLPRSVKRCSAACCSYRFVFPDCCQAFPTQLESRSLEPWAKINHNPLSSLSYFLSGCCITAIQKYPIHWRKLLLLHLRHHSTSHIPTPHPHLSLIEHTHLLVWKLWWPPKESNQTHISRWRAHSGFFMNWHSWCTSSVPRLLFDRHRWVKFWLLKRAEARMWQLTGVRSQLSSLHGEPHTPNRENNEVHS